MVSLSQCVRVSAIIFGKADVKILLKVNPSKEAFSGAVPCLVIIRLFLTLLRSLSSIKRQGVPMTVSLKAKRTRSLVLKLEHALG